MSIGKPIKTSNFEPDPEKPTAAGYVYGWRSWNISTNYDTPRLQSPTKRKTQWPAKAHLEAICTHSDDRRLTCRCGIYAYDTQARLFASSYRSQDVLGEIKMWGEVSEATAGAQGQFAYPTQLFVNPHVINKHGEDICEKLAKAYNVPVRFLTEQELEKLKAVPVRHQPAISSPAQAAMHRAAKAAYEAGAQRAKDGQQANADSSKKTSANKEAGLILGVGAVAIGFIGAAAYLANKKDQGNA